MLLAFQLALSVATLLSLLRLVRRSRLAALSLLLMNMVLYATLLLSSAKGMIAHKYLWLLLLFQVILAQPGVLHQPRRGETT